MENRIRNAKRRYPTAIASVMALLVVALPGLADAQEAIEGVTTACYVPPSGVVYVVDAPGAPDGCLDERHVEFSWPATSTLGGESVLGRAATAEAPTTPPGQGDGQGGGGAPTVPTGAIMFFDLETCPSGWTELEDARGRSVVGRPDAGTLGGTVGSPLADLEDRTHVHGTTAVTAQASADGGHDHELDGIVRASFSGVHNHIWGRISHGQGRTFTSFGTATSAGLVDWSNGIGNAGEGHFPFASSNFSSGNWWTSKRGGHRHNVNLDNGGNTTSAPDHAHDVSVDIGNTDEATTSSVMPYLQLLTCRKD